MSATTRHEKAAQLRFENDALREERNAMIRTNAELLKEIEQLRERAEKAEAALKELVLATANDMRHSEDENQDKAWSALEDLKNALVTADTILSGTWKEDE